ncbi:tripartite tricarboxylate transporter substrate-binding protein [Bradyrhizobium sp. CB3481]|uniref:tripartite tricarboxylate transporter substrate-binding protein n=1 Tax=Bradyrhizobium sp. CB3481 TaxID=3039158 RepID=UPI0024B0BF4D|nr:tripartite tricarboxylate transporter substrate-binding protein [Bradyrhizobium sp. CB3481]WFU15841.1 tripartite tricarboxylate transporter substrate-binding protein [Bradyrhizobium sp. CB3481]
MPRRAMLLLTSLVAMIVSTYQPAAAGAWPHRTVKIIAPIPTGGATDLAARLFAEGLSQRWGQAVVVENRPGADGIAGVTTFVNAHDDQSCCFRSRRRYRSTR